MEKFKKEREGSVIAFRDITKVLYDGKVKIDYKDGNHAYYARLRKDWDLDENDPKAWDKAIRPKGTTTLLDQTLEKKGIVGWAVSLVARELFGFYCFKDDFGNEKIGFSKDVGTLWSKTKKGEVRQLEAYLEDQLAPIVKSAHNAHLTKKQEGADVGSVVHDAIEHYIVANPHKLVPLLDKEGQPVLDEKGKPKTHYPGLQPSNYDIGENYMWNIKEAFPLPEKGTDPDPFEAERNLAFEAMPMQVEKATTAFLQFQLWWEAVRPELHSAEDILYSMEKNICGTYDADISIPRDQHPIHKNDKTMPDTLRIRADWKTSNASKSKDAASPEGVYYSYFIQMAIYEMMAREMGLPPADDLLCVSARKDGGFSTVYLSELGFTIERMIEWANRVIFCYRDMAEMKEALLEHGAVMQDKLLSVKEEF